MAVRRLTGTAARGSAFLFAILVLAVALTLSACAGSGSGSNGDIVSVPTSTPEPPAPQQVVQADSDLDAFLVAMDSAAADASLDQSSNDNSALVPVAAASLGSPNGGSALVSTLAFAAPQPGCDLPCLQKFGDDKIASRLKDLNDLSTKIADLGTKDLLTTTQVSTLQGKISQAENDLNAEKSKLDAIAASDPNALATARQDDKDIFEKFRVYAILLPLVRHMEWADLASNALTRMSGLSSKIQTAISAAPASQQANLTQLFTDYQAKVADAQTQLQNATSLFDGLTPDAYNKSASGVKTIINSLNKDLRAAHADIKAARADLHQIATVIKADAGSSTATATATSSTTATATP